MKLKETSVTKSLPGCSEQEMQQISGGSGSVVWAVRGLLMGLMSITLGAFYESSVQEGKRARAKLNL